MSESPERAHSERTRVSLGFPQDRREVPLATGISGSPNGGRSPTLPSSQAKRPQRRQYQAQRCSESEVKEKMFNPFFTTKPAGEGTGLGLSISHDIVVKQHGGSIEVDTQPGEFTEIRIILPRAAVLLPHRALNDDPDGRFTPKADICGALAHVRFGPKANVDGRRLWPLSATSDVSLSHLGFSTSPGDNTFENK